MVTGPYTLEEKREIAQERSRRYKIRNREEADVPNNLKGYHRKLRNAMTILEEILLKKKELKKAIEEVGLKPRDKSIDFFLNSLETSVVNIFTAIRILNVNSKEFRNDRRRTKKLKIE